MSPRRPLLTILTPTFNGARHLEACARNVAEQQCDAVEHIIIDGGSDDGTVGILQRLEASTPSLRWVSEPDRGQSDAMNKGRALARGELIGVLNVDDYYEPGVLSRVIDLFAQSPHVDMFVGACNVRDPSGTIAYVNRPRVLSVFALLVGFPHPVNPAAYFYRTSVHDRTGGFDVEDHYSMDVDFIYRAFASSRVNYVDEVWGNFVTWPEAKTTQDKAAGTALARRDRLRKRYVATLPLWKRLLIVLFRPFIVLTRKVINTLHRPGDTLKRYKRKLIRPRGSSH
jgi:glycosyltransferase involved in cell wall biosynthesis